MAEIQSVRIHHEMILTWLITNPDKTQGECAREFNVTEVWLSTVINSDVFQARWAERRTAMANGVDGQIMASAKTVALKALARLEKVVEVSPDPELILSTTDKLLGRLGYGPKTTGAAVSVTQNNTFLSVDAATLAEARKRITAQLPPPETPITIEVTDIQVEESAPLSRDQDS